VAAGQFSKTTVLETLDYLHTIQLRAKWNTTQPNIQFVLQLVLIQEDNWPPRQWSLARVTAVIPGQDGKVRVVNLKTSTSVFRRPIHKIAPLTVEIESPSFQGGKMFEEKSN